MILIYSSRADWKYPWCHIPNLIPSKSCFCINQTTLTKWVMLEPVFQNSTMYRRIETFTRTIRSWIHRSPLVPASNHPPLFFFSNLTPDSLGDSKQRSSWFCDKRVQNSSTIFTIIPKFVGKLGTIKLIPYIDSSVIFQCNPNTRARLEHHARKRI